MSNALLYVRVSSTEQEKEGYSLDAQERLGHDYAQRKNLKIVKTWKVSESAWHQERTAFNLMVEYAKRHPEAGHIIFDVTDRMTRNDFDKLKIYTLIKEFGKTVHFSRTNKLFNKESGSDDEFMFDIEVAVAKKMSNDISRKTKMGLLEKAEQGIFPSAAPLGYRNNPITHLIDIDEAIAPHVKRAFELMGSGSYSLSMVRDIIRDEGFRGKKGHKVGKAVVAFIVKNPFYFGAFLWKGKLYQGSHTPLVSKELFDRVQAVLSGKRHAHPFKKDFAFNNLMNCGLCECMVSGEQKKKKYHYYHCTFTKGRHLDVSYIREERLAEMFEEPIKKVTLAPDLADWLVDALRERSKGSAVLYEARRNVLQGQLKKAQDRLSRLYDMRIDGDVPDEVFQAKEREYKGQTIELRAQINACGSATSESWDQGLKTFELSKTLHQQYKRADFNEKAKILRLVASNFTLTENKLIPTYRKPFSWIAEGLSRPNWLPLLDDVCNWLSSSENVPDVSADVYRRAPPR